MIRHKTGGPAIRNKQVTRQVLIDALMNDDLDTFRDVLISHLRATSKTELAKDTRLGRQTLYDLMNPDIEFNPTLRACPYGFLFTGVGK